MDNSTNSAVPTASSNPLSKYFRQPAIYMKLPSGGRFWADNALELPVNGEIPVYPMTARDEVSLRTPDSLMNGQGVVDVIQSCCPNVKGAWAMPSVDVDAVLIGIRIASYGNEMDLDTVCPFCQSENNHALDLRSILDTIVCPDYVKKIEVNDLKIKVKPQQFATINKQNSISFEEQRMLEALEKSDLTAEERASRVAESMSKLLEISIDTVTNCTELIELDDGSIVNNVEYIREFYNNVDSSVVRAVQKRLGEINAEAEIKARKVACTNADCAKEYEIPLEFDYANFFVKGS